MARVRLYLKRSPGITALAAMVALLALAWGAPEAKAPVGTAAQARTLA